MIALPNYIRRYSLDPNVCQKLIRVYEQSPKHQIDEWWRRCGNVTIWDPALLAEITDLVNGWMILYRQDIGEAAGGGTLNFCGELETPNLFRYDPNPDAPNLFNIHADCWNSDTATRQVSIIAYLNGVEQGGETVFPNINETVYPKEGRVIVFPSSWQFMHKANPPVSGSKYILVSWVHFKGKPGKFTTTPL